MAIISIKYPLLLMFISGIHILMYVRQDCAAYPISMSLVDQLVHVIDAAICVWILKESTSIVSAAKVHVFSVAYMCLYSQTPANNSTDHHFQHNFKVLLSLAARQCAAYILYIIQCKTTVHQCTSQYYEYT